MRKFPKSIEDFANMFVSAQLKRFDADYNPSSRFSRSEVITDIDAAEAAIIAFEGVATKHRRAFAAWVTIKARS